MGAGHSGNELTELTAWQVLESIGEVYFKGKWTL